MPKVSKTWGTNNVKSWWASGLYHARAILW